MLTYLHGLVVVNFFVELNLEYWATLVIVIGMHPVPTQLCYVDLFKLTKLSDTQERIHHGMTITLQFTVIHPRYFSQVAHLRILLNSNKFFRSP